MSGYNWDDYKSTGEWISFRDIGDQVIGDIIAIRTGTDFNGNPCPELILRTDDGEERTLTAGQTLLKSALAEQAPQVGDKIFIKYTGNTEAKPGKAPAKQFQVAVKTGEGNVDPTLVSAQQARDEVAATASAAAGGPVPTHEIPF